MEGTNTTECVTTKTFARGCGVEGCEGSVTYSNSERVHVLLLGKGKYDYKMKEGGQSESRKDMFSGLKGIS